MLRRYTAILRHCGAIQGVSVTNRSVCLWLMCALAASSSVLAAPPQTLNDLVDKNTQARGGMTALHAMRSLTLRGKLLVNEGQIELGFVQIVERPSNIRVEASIQGLTQVQAYNGTIGWQIGRHKKPRGDDRRLRRLARRCKEQGQPTRISRH
jgi:hypothetical protein